MANKQRGKTFFEELTPLRHSLEHVVRTTKRVAGGNAHDPDKITAAEEKRKRKAYARLRNAGLVK